jgi:N-acetylmuramoyl-L-alanine amidase
MLLREGDDSLTLDQRAEASNAARALIYISLHAASKATARVYTAPCRAKDRIEAVSPECRANSCSPLSQVSQPRSSTMQSANSQLDLSASLRPLNNLVVPAVAVELAPRTEQRRDLPSANYQQRPPLPSPTQSPLERLETQP